MTDVTQTPALCRMVIAVGAAARGNGADVAPAVITRVWSDTLVNATVFRDCGAPQVITSAYLFGDEESARASLQNDTTTALYWPPRN